MISKLEKRVGLASGNRAETVERGGIHLSIACVFLVCLLACSKQTELPTVTSREADFAHEHKHQHGSGQIHDHEHEDFNGSHSHEHPHGHRHGGGVQSAIIISIGHDRHTENGKLFHAEILPIRDQTVTFILSVENAAGTLEPHSIEQDKLTGYASDADSSISKVHEFHFESLDGEGIQFEAQVPKSLLDSDSLSVLVTQIELEGEAHSFRFLATAAAENSQTSSAATLEQEGKSGLP